MLSREANIIYEAICQGIEDRTSNGKSMGEVCQTVYEIIAKLDKVSVKIYCENCENLEKYIPEYAHDIEDACMDLRAKQIERKADKVICHTGIYIELPKFYQLNIYPRSNITKSDWCIQNSPGIVDSGYRGEILVIFRPIHNMDREDFPYKEGDRIAQCQVVKYQEVIWKKVNSLNDLTPSQRGNDGYGSTGNS